MNMLRFAAAGPAVLYFVCMASAGIRAEEAVTPPVKDGQNYGLAAAAAQYCPAGVLTEKGKALATKFTGAEGEAFKAEADKIAEAWSKGANCSETEMDPHQLAMCRTMRLRNCRAVWSQVGPEGTVDPGLVDVDYSKAGD